MFVSPVRNAMQDGVKMIIVDNTNIQAAHMKPYVAHVRTILKCSKSFLKIAAESRFSKSNRTKCIQFESVIIYNKE